MQQHIFAGLQKFRAQQFEAIQAAASGTCLYVPVTVWQQCFQGQAYFADRIRCVCADANWGWQVTLLWFASYAEARRGPGHIATDWYELLATTC